MSVQSVTFTQKLFHNTSRFTLRSDRTPPQSVLWTDRGPWNNTMLPICTSTEAQDTRGAKRRKNVVQWSRSGSEPHVKRQERESPQVRFQQQSFSADLLPPSSLQCFHRRTNREKKNLKFEFIWLWLSRAVKINHVTKSRGCSQCDRFNWSEQNTYLKNIKPKTGLNLINNFGISYSKKLRHYSLYAGRYSRQNPTKKDLGKTNSINVKPYCITINWLITVSINQHNEYDTKHCYVLLEQQQQQQGNVCDSSPVFICD